MPSYLKLGIEVFCVHLLGKEFIVQTDHRVLQWLQTRGSNERLMRWSIALQAYVLTVHYSKGAENSNADSLSRMEDGLRLVKKGRV